MTDGNTGESGIQGIWSKFLAIFDKGKDEVVRSSKLSKARLDLSSLKKEREKVFERLGEEIYKRQKEKKISLPGIDSFLTEIEIINLKLSSKERELKSLSGEALPVAKAEEEVTRPERREGHFRPRRRRPYPPREAKPGVTPPEGEKARSEHPESEKGPRKRFHRPRRRPSGARPEVKKETGQEG